MERIKKWRRFALALFSLLFVGILSFALVQIIPARADEEPITVTIHNGGNGTVTVNGDQIISADQASNTVEVTVVKGGTLNVKAEGAIVSGDDASQKEYIFQYWSTGSASGTGVSVKAEDTFTYDECKAFTSKDLYANFVEGLPEDKQEANKITVKYEERLGDVYFFMGKENATQEEIVNHGILIRSEVEAKLPFKYLKRTLSSTVIEQITASDVTLAAIPKTGIQSTLDPSRTTTAEFIEWGAEFAGGSTSAGATFYNQALPPYMKSRSVGTQNHPDGTVTIMATAIPVGPMWFTKSLSGSTKSPDEAFYTVSSKQIVNDNENNWYWNKFDNHLTYGSSLYVKPQSISVKFQEVAIVPKMTLTPTVGEEEQDAKTSTDLRTTISIPYGEQNSLRVLLGELPNAETQSYQISVNRGRNLTTGEFNTDDTTKYEESDGGYLFNVDEIDINTKIVITPDYGEKYVVNPIVIDVMLTEDIQKIVADDSASVKILGNGEGEPGDEWYLDPQFKSGSGALSFTSKNSYPETVNSKEQKNVSNLHFQVTGSGVFTFEFYLDGMQSWGGSLALYRLGEPVTTSDFRYNGIESKSQAKQLAIGDTYQFTDTQYGEPKINPVNGVERLTGSVGWCVATIHITAEEAQTTDIYVAHGTSDYNVLSSTATAYMTHTVMSVRNVAFYQGASNVSWKIYGGEEYQSYGTITAQVNGEDIGMDSAQDSGTRITFTVDPQEYHFYGWSDGEKLLSTEETFIYTVHGSNGVEASKTTIYAVVAPENTYYFQNGGKFYLETQLQDALSGATTNPRVYILQNAQASGDITIPNGVELILPYDAAGNFSGNGRNYPGNASAIPSWKATGKAWATPYLTFTLTGNMTINGTFDIGAVNHCESQNYSGLTSGAYSQLINNGTITVAKGGLMDVYGLVTGEGKIDVKNGGKLAEPFLILDYAGGTNTLALYQAYQTPFNRYAMINIQCGITINYGGELLGHASLYAMGGIFLASAPVISYATRDDDANARGLIMLTENGKVDITYTEEDGIDNTSNSTKWIGRSKLTFTGGAVAKFMSLNVGFTISTEDVVAFSIPYNFAIELNDGNYTISGNFKLMPGSSLTVNEGATLNLNSNFFVYDGLVQSKMSGKYYPTATELTNAKYSTNANFIVNGKLNINATATFLGVIQTANTKGTAEIVVAKGATISGTIKDGGLSGYDCNYSEYESSLRLYDKVHDGGKLVSVPVNAEGKAEKDMTFKSTWTEGDNSHKWELPATNLKYDSHDYGGSTEGHIDHESKDHPYFVDGTTEPVSDMVGSWMIEHDTHTFDWKSLSEEEKELNGAKYKELTRQCTELGCNDKEHHLLLKSGETLSATYKGSAFTNDDLVKLFYKYYFESETVPAEVLENCKFSASVSSNHGTIQGANTYEGITVTLVNGFFGDVKNTSEKFIFTVEQFNLKDLNTNEIETALEKQNFTYDGTAKTLNLAEALKGAFGSEVSFSTEWNNNTNAGTATVTITGTGDNFTGSTAPIEFSIAKATLRVEVVDKEKTYDGTAWENVEKAAQGTDFTIADGKIYNSDDLGLKLTVGGPSADVGDYTVTGAASNANYTVTVTEGTYKITRAALTVNIASKSHTYGETAAELSYTLNGVQNGEESSIRALLSLKSDGAEQWKDVNQYNITAWYSDSEIKNTLEAESGDVLKNYTVTVSGGENAYTVKQKSIEGATFTVTETYTYDKTEKKPTMSEIEVTLEGYADEHKVTFTVDGYSDNTDAGTAHLTVNATGNFTGTKAVDFTIGKATVDSITVNGEYAYTGAVQSDAVKSKIVVKSGALTLDTGDYTVTFDRNGEKDVKDAGTYTVTVELTNACKNYQLGEVTTATFEVAKADITIKADDQHTPKGEPILAGDALTWTVTNTAGGKGAFSEDDRETLKAHISVTTDADKDTVNSNYTITIKWSDSYEPANYTVTFVNGTYSVDDTIWKYVSVTGAETIKYDGTAHTLTVEVNNEELNGKTTVTQTIGEHGDTFEGATNVGTYEVTVTITAQGYTSSFTGKYTITITARQVTVTFDPASSVYGNDVEKNFTYQTSGDTVLDGDNEKFEAAIAAANPHTTATNKSGVDGSYTITTDKTPELDNYTITVKDGKYTITARDVEVTVSKQTVTYNQKSQSAQSRNETDWSVTNLAGGDDATVLNINLEANGTNAGSYDITATWSNKNYAVTFKGADGLVVEQGNKVKNAFVIEAAELTDATVTGSYTYNGQTQTPTFNVKAGDLVVEEGGFELVFAEDADRVSAGTVNVTVKAKGSNYTGSLEKSFTIAAKKIKVTLNAQTADYSGEVPTPDNKAYTVNDSDLCSQNGVKDDLGITITLVNGNKNVGSYGLDATASNKNYEVEFDKTAQFSVTKKQITVKADDLKSFYGDDLKELTYTAEGLVEGEDAKTVLSITLEPERTIKEVGAYTIRGTGSAENYAFDKVEEGTYTVEKREVTVTINDQSSLYDGTEPEVVQGQGDGWTVPDGSIIAGDNLFIVLTKAEGADAAEYAISGAFRNDNYNVTFKGTMGEAGKFTIRARQLTVEIHDQSETYDHEKAQKQYGKEYKFDSGAWSIVLSSGDGLADGETREMLEISLHVAGTLSNAGKYAIAGECGNTNYAVTFTGNYDEDGEYKGTAGLYTIEKLDVSEEAAFMLSVKDGSDIKTEEGGAVVRVKFAGKAIELVCETTLLMGEDSVELATKLSRESIGAEEGIGSYEITVTIDDVNYCGQAVITVIVTDANGYTQRLKDVLAQLGELTAELDKEHLKAEDYTVLLEVVKALGSLDEEERKVGAEELAEYEEYVTAWEELADIGEVIETAKTVANAPIAALFEAAATLTALAGLAYIAFKGGML